MIEATTKYINLWKTSQEFAIKITWKRFVVFDHDLASVSLRREKKREMTWGELVASALVWPSWLAEVKVLLLSEDWQRDKIRFLPNQKGACHEVMVLLCLLLAKSKASKTSTIKWSTTQMTPSAISESLPSSASGILEKRLLERMIMQTWSSKMMGS